MSSETGRVFVIGLVAVFVIAQLALTVAALVVWARTPEDRFSINRWVWLALILVVSWLGALAFLFAGRRPALIADAPQIRDPDATRATLDTLYGKGAEPGDPDVR